MITRLRTIERKIATVDFVQSDVATKDLIRTHPYKDFLLRLTGQLVIGVANATGVVGYSPLSLIKQVRLMLNGEMGLKAYTGKLDYIQNQLDSRIAGEKVAPGTTVGTHDFSGTLKVHFELPHYPEDWCWLTRLNSALLTELAIEILFGQGSDLVTPGGSTTLAIQNCKVEVSALEYPDVEAQRVYSMFKEYEKKITVAGATTELPLEIKTKNPIISILILGVLNGADSDALINKVSPVIDGTDFQKVLSWQTLKQNSAEHYGIAMPTGVASLVFDKSKDLTQLLELAGAGTFELIFDVNAPTGVTYIQVLIRELIPFEG